jgi:TolB-like protein/Tfp pilus assembly protein PilF
MSLYNELKRRNVLRVGAAYIVAAWLIIQVVETIFPAFGFGDAAIRMVVIVLAIAFIPSLVLSWVFEITPEGMKREVDVVRDDSTTFVTGKRIDRIIMVLLALAMGYFAFDKFVLDPARDDQIVETAHQEGRAEALVETYGDKSIAVLAFVNMSDDASNEYFSDGISEEILSLLTKIPELRVISRSSAFSFKGKGTQIPEIAKILNVAHILEGSVRKAGNRVRITAQLIDARSDTHLWSETYDRNVLDVFAVQDEIAAKISKQLELTLVSSRPSGRPTENKEAYEQYLRGLYLLRQLSPQQSGLAAREHFQAAIDLDPEYAQAFAQLSLSLIVLGNLHILSPTEVLPKAQEAAKTAFELDKNLFEAHIALGWVAMSYERDWSKSENEFRRAIKLAPGDYQGYQGLAWPLQVTGRYDEALASVLKARDVDPLSLWTRSTLSDIFYKRREYDAALELIPYLLETGPEGYEGAWLTWLGQIYAAKQEPLKALSYAKQAAGLTGGDPSLELGVALIYAMLGDQSEARKILQKIDLEDETRFVSPGYPAAVYANLGENDLAMEFLARSVEEYDSWIWNLDYPMWDAIRSDPRFIALCEGLEMACAEQ